MKIEKPVLVSQHESCGVCRFFNGFQSYPYCHLYPNGSEDVPIPFMDRHFAQGRRISFNKNFDAFKVRAAFCENGFEKITPTYLKDNPHLTMTGRQPVETASAVVGSLDTESYYGAFKSTHSSNASVVCGRSKDRVSAGGGNNDSAR